MDRIIDERWDRYQEGIGSWLLVIDDDPLTIRIDHHVVTFQNPRIIIDDEIIIDDSWFDKHSSPPFDRQVYITLPMEGWHGYRIIRGENNDRERGIIVTGSLNYAVAMTGESGMMVLHLEEMMTSRPWDRTTIMRWPGDYLTIHEDDNGNRVIVTMNDRIVIEAWLYGHYEVVTLLLTDNYLDRLIISYPGEGDLVDTVIAYEDEYYRLSNGSIVSPGEIHHLIGEYFRLFPLS